MKEILFDFEKFKNRTEIDSHFEDPHYAFRSTPSKNGIFVTIEFRIYARRRGTDHILIFERSEGFVAYDTDQIKAFSDDMKNLASKVSATPGYYEEEMRA